MWNFFSFFLTNKEGSLEFNSNILETNAINLALLLGLLIYGNQISIQPGLEERKDQIVLIIENAQKDVLDASNYYSVTETAFLQSIFWLKSWKGIYEKEKIDIVNNKYKIVKSGLTETFQLTEKLIENFETKSFLSLQRYILYVMASKMLRKFLFLTNFEKSKLIGILINNLGGNIN